MNEAAAREVFALQAFEETLPPSPSWTDSDRAWADRLSREQGGAQAGAEAAIALRARHALRRLAPREPLLAKWLAHRLWRGRWFAWAGLLGIVAGLLADSIGASQRINLLALPVAAVLVWNAVVYLLWLGDSLWSLRRRQPRRPGWLVRATQRLLRLGSSLPRPSAAGTPAADAGPLPALAGRWLRRSAPLTLARATALLHAAAAALGLGLIAGLYARGVVLDYRAAWESTFLSAGAAHAVVSTLLGPASKLSGIAVPDAAGFEALRMAHGSTAPGAPAGPWIHLVALTLLLFVVLPRAALALGSGLRARWLGRHFPLPLADEYFKRVLRQLRDESARVEVVPYAHTPLAQAALGLRALLVPAFGDRLELHVAPTVAFGAEDDAAAAPRLPADTRVALALFDLAATPEAENQGRFVRQLAGLAPAGAAVIMLIDETGFKRRFGVATTRLAQRREAWRLLAGALGSVPVFADLEAPDGAAAQPALQAALGAPVVAG